MSDAPAPRANPDLIGHETTEATLRQLFDSSRLPHALLLEIFTKSGIGTEIVRDAESPAPAGRRPILGRV